VTFSDDVIGVHDALDAAQVTHGFGGALALGFYAEPRLTADIDVNVFTSDADPTASFEALDAIGYVRDADAATAPFAGVRLRGRGSARVVDVFLPIDHIYEEIAARLRSFPFGPERRELPFLSVEDLVLFKVSFNRDKDWVDIRRIVEHGHDLDLPYIDRQLVALRGPTMHPRLAHLRRIVGL
jgi:hypothetical protein